MAIETNHVRLQTLDAITERVAHLPGSIAEIGVYRGVSAHFIASTYPDKQIHLFDTFSGMPDSMLTEIDGDGGKGGWVKFSKNSLAGVKKKLERFDNLQFHPGEFPTTAEELDSEEKFCLVNVDIDLYIPTRAACELFYPKMVPGGVMVLNDYRAPTCKGATLAIDDFFADKPEDIVFGGNERTFVVIV